MTWRMDGYVICPRCGRALDGAAVFGDDTDDDYGLRDGTESVPEEPCGCGARFRIRIEVIAGT
jgi:hypothetical protein